VDREKVISAWKLGQQEFEPLNWIIPGVIPMEGIMLMAAPPKAGKSIFILNLIIDCALQRKVLGFADPPKRINTLYLDLENSDRRAQERINKISGGQFPTNLDVAIQWERLGSGGLTALRHHLKEHQLTDIIVVDVLNKMLPSRGTSGQYSYQLDAEDIGRFRIIVEEFGVMIILIHHTRKQDSADWVEKIIGTQGIAGSCDTLMLLERDRASTSATLRVTGRDVSEESYRLIFNQEDYRWLMAGRRDTSNLSAERTNILAVVKGCEEALRPIEVARLLHKSEGSIRRMMANMERDGLLIRESYGHYVDRMEI